MRILQTIVKRILALVIISFFGFLGIALLCLEPVSILTCCYVETAQVDCRLQERIVGVIPVWEIPITRLKKAYVDLEYQTREDEDGKEYTVSIYRIILVSASGEIGFGGTEEKAALFAGGTTKRINDFLNAPTDESLTVWHAAWVGVLAVTLAGGLFLGLSIFMLVMTVLDMLGLSQKVKDQMARFRRKVESA